MKHLELSTITATRDTTTMVLIRGDASIETKMEINKDLAMRELTATATAIVKKDREDIISQLKIVKAAIEEVEKISRDITEKMAIEKQRELSMTDHQ
jgi:hypothetical protein